MIHTRILALLVVYTLIAVGSLWLGYEARFEFDVPADFRIWRTNVFAVVVPLKIILLVAFGQFGSLVAYFRMPDVRSLILASGTASVLLLLLRYTAGVHFAPPLSVILFDFLLFTTGVGLFRMLLRRWKEKRNEIPAGDIPLRSVAIFGAGEIGSSLVTQMLGRPAMGGRPVVLFDDDPAKKGRKLHGVPIAGPIDRLPSVI